MKNKNLVSLAAVFMMLLFGNNVFSQCTSPVPNTTDAIALPTTNVAGCPGVNTITTTNNTGTDVYLDGANYCQVNVWDGTNASFSWSYGTSAGSIAFTAMAPLSQYTISDPDVVVNRHAGATWAMVVCQIDGGAGFNVGQIFWGAFRWSGTTFQLMASGFLGDVLNFGNCTNPNIDVNQCGRIVIAWAQSTTYSITITTSGGPAGFNFGPVSMSIKRSDIFSAQGFVDGVGCNGAGVVRGVVTNIGDRVSFPGTVPHLFEANLTPDVSFSDPLNGTGTCTAGTYAITYSYIQQWFDPSQFTFVSRLLAKETYGDICINPNSIFTIYTFNNMGLTTRPRIASRPSNTGANYDDFQIVMSDPASVCTCGPVCPIYNTRIYNWGKHNGTAAPLYPAAPNALNMMPISPCNLNTFYNDEAVVTYRDLTTSATGDFVVAWTNGGGITNGVSNDVIARTYNQGVVNLAVFGQYSLVNRGCNGLTNAQSRPSIAGRYFPRVGYEFWDHSSTANKPYIGYKLSQVQCGNGAALRPAGPGNNEADESFNVQPNPFSNEISFNFNLSEENKASQIEITDMSGRLVETIKIADNMNEITWKPASDVKDGVYYAKLYTTKGTMISKIMKKN